MIRVRISYGLLRFVGVTANITDCRSVAMSSILIRTANAAYALMAVCRSSKPEESVRITHAAPMPDGVIGNIPEFESGVLSSNLSLVSKDVGFSLSVKHPSVQRRNRVRIPVSTNDGL